VEENILECSPGPDSPDLEGGFDDLQKQTGGCRACMDGKDTCASCTLALGHVVQWSQAHAQPSGSPCPRYPSIMVSNIVFISFVFIILLKAKGEQGSNFQVESPDNDNVSRASKT
jgi:hypothetical protein